MGKIEVLIIDSNGFYHKNYTALANLEYYGNKVGGLYGYIRNLIYKLKELGLSFADTYHCFDLHGRVKRAQIYAGYKGTRQRIKEPDFLSLLSELEMFLLSVGANVAKAEGYEADEVIAYLVKVFSNEGKRVGILSDDKDLLQLLDYNGVVLYTKDGALTKSNLKSRFGVESGKEWLYVKCLMGDTSDNITGFDGIGLKTALKIVADPQELEKYKKTELFERNLQLMNLLDVEVKDLTIKKGQRDKQKALFIINKYGMKSLLKMLEEVKGW
ncbi:MAG: hypothetical protein QXY76_03245 [Nitrososphaeria archaeon]